jgi:hypothetical protein
MVLVVVGGVLLLVLLLPSQLCLLLLPLLSDCLRLPPPLLLLLLDSLRVNLGDDHTLTIGRLWALSFVVGESQTPAPCRGRNAAAA